MPPFEEREITMTRISLLVCAAVIGLGSVGVASAQGHPNASVNETAATTLLCKVFGLCATRDDGPTTDDNGVVNSKN
jgi:hypothetical protein